MFFANDENGNRRSVSHTGQRGFCIGCGEEVVSVCGDIKTWHWRHKVNPCKYFAGKETAWHKTWKLSWGYECAEIMVRKRGAIRFADARLPHGLVIELQHSSITAREIKNRERHYGSLVWVFDISGLLSSDRLTITNLRAADYLEKPIQTFFEYRNPKITPDYCSCPVFYDIGDKRVMFIQSKKETFEILEYENDWGGEPYYSEDKRRVWRGRCITMSRDWFVESLSVHDDLAQGQIISIDRDFLYEIIGHKKESISPIYNGIDFHEYPGRRFYHIKQKRYREYFTNNQEVAA